MTNPMNSTAPGGRGGGDAVAAFMAVREHFEHATRACGTAHRCYRIGGHIVRLQFAGPALVPFVAPALSHLEAEAGEAAALTVCIWDTASTGTDAPVLPSWWWDGSTGRGPVQAYHGDRLHTAVHASTLSMLDAATDTGLCCVGDVAQLTCSETGSPLLRILHWWMRGRDLQLVHGGAVGNEDGGVILAGRGGSGKSTTSLLALTSDLLYAADDYCLVSTVPSPRVHSLYCSGKVDARDISRFPLLAPALSNADRLPGEKALFMLHDRFAARLSTGFPIRAVVVPRVTGRRDTTLTRVAGSVALLALAPSTIFQLPGAGAPALRQLARLTSQVPSYVLETGTDLAQIPQRIINLLADIDTAQGDRDGAAVPDALAAGRQPGVPHDRS